MADAIDRLEMTELLNGHQIHIDVAADGYAGLYAANSAHESPLASVTGRTEIATMFRRLGATG
jgi:hypothetical protein